MPAPHSRSFRDGKTLEGELAAAMHRVEAHGVIYPAHYYETLVAKYRKGGVPYPHILTILGEPRILGHFYYKTALQRTGPFLDYGCGTGDNIRQLLRDGFPRDHITGFDLSWESIDLGFDLYRDRDALRDLFVVQDTFPFGEGQFDTIYSGSVIHVIADDAELDGYLANAWRALRHGGVLFGSTLGIEDCDACSPDEHGPPRVSPRSAIVRHMMAAGFAEPAIMVKSHEAHHPGDKKCVFEFCTKKDEKL
ncbi:class I SAM-dependent methyltransferase [Methanoregula sp.]|uniref:class I SAM-dependent methyltransferase n=1 Tax=Methanoregula sp. TaxID=2052170 RepID=UPI002C9F8CE9|nr:class I SAM-dependent methyltransferase [Methanoregula sp.]HVP96295.1 class I SAM-dependent methyltransferase [Methanoregula sp.]